MKFKEKPGSAYFRGLGKRQDGTFETQRQALF